MALDLESQGQLSLLEQGAWQTTMRVEPDHRLVMLCQSIAWDELMEKAVPILYDEQGIDADIGRPLNLRAHLGAYILQTVHHWTDRWTEEMVRFYFPARLFCGYLDSTGSLDRTRIEDFRNRFGEKGAELVTGDMIQVAKELGFTKGDDVDMDTTVQEAGITHPTEMKLMKRLIGKVKAIHGELRKNGKRGIEAIKSIATRSGEIETQYRFFAKTKDKILSLWKLAPTAIGKGKLSKPVEFGRKWVVNAYTGGYVLLTAPENPKISDQECVWESLNLHQDCFNESPRSYANDRGMWGIPNLELCLNAGIKKIGIQPKGKAKALVGRKTLR